MVAESFHEKDSDVFASLFAPDGFTRAKAGYVVRPAGEMVISQGDIDARLFVILRGRVAVTKLFESGHEKFVCELGTGQYFGELSALDPAPRSASVRTLEESEFAVIGRLDLLAALRSNEALVMRLLVDFARRIREDVSRLDTQRPVSERLQTVLANFGAAVSGDESFLVSATRQELATRCHADVKTVSRELTKLERAGAIEREGRLIRVHRARMQKRAIKR